VKSVNFRTFEWVLIREAATEIICSAHLIGERRSTVRGLLARSDRSQVLLWVARAWTAYEKWRKQ